LANILPPEFIKAIQIQFETQAPDLLDSIFFPPTPSVRFNPLKPVPRSHFPVSSLVSWTSFGAFLSHRPEFILDPLLHAGTYYVQEASSMIMDHIVSQLPLPPAPLVLDLCAAPGGKSCGLLSTLPPDALLVSNEIVKQRSNILAENLSKWGFSNLVVTQAEPGQLAEMGETFDLIVADMPCSGEGMFRKNPASIGEWSIENVQICAARQKDILHKAWDLLQPGGFLIYSTCTFNQSENEEILANFRELETFIQPNMTNPEPNQVSESTYKNINAFRLLPNKTKGEGLFEAVLQKPGFRERVQTYKIKEPWIRQPNKQAFNLLDTYLPDLKNKIGVFSKQNQVLAFPHSWSGFINMLNRYVWVVKTGTCLFDIQHQNVIPHQDLALSPLNKFSIFPQLELNRKQAQQFLRKQSFELPEAQQGILLITYEGFELGWIKNMGNRFNNYYPQEWRIRFV